MGVQIGEGGERLAEEGEGEREIVGGGGKPVSEVAVGVPGEVESERIRGYGVVEERDEVWLRESARKSLRAKICYTQHRGVEE